MVCGSCSPSRKLSMGDSRPMGSSLTGGGGGGHHCSPPSRVVEAESVAPWGVQLIASGLSTEVVETILQFRAPSTRKSYTAKWHFFTSWCDEHQLDPVNCPVGPVLEFLQDRFATGLSPSTLKVYVAAIAAYHAPLGKQSLGRNPLVTRFLKGTQRLRPLVRPRVPAWNLAVVLEALSKALFEPLGEVSLRFLTIKTAFLLAISSLKRVCDLQALSVAPSCLEFAPGMARAFLYPICMSPRYPLLFHGQLFFRCSVLLPFGTLTRKSLIVCVQSTELPCGGSRTSYLFVTVRIRTVFLQTSRPSAGG